MLPNAKGLTPSAILERAVHPETPSDAMYRFVFRHGPMARGLLRLVLPPGMVGEDAEVTAIDGDLVSQGTRSNVEPVPQSVGQVLTPVSKAHTLL